jgi:cardiolipin synthase
MVAWSLFPPEGWPLVWLAIEIAWLLHLIAFGFVCYDCLKTRREIASALVWIFIAWSLPVIGLLLYLGFGVHRVPMKGWRKQVHDERFLAQRRALEEEAYPLAYWRAMVDMVAAEPQPGLSRRLNHAMDSILPDFPLLAGNNVRLLCDGTTAFPAMLEAIREARHHIHLQTYILGHDDIGRRFLDALAEKARAGVEVRVLVDRFGSTGAVLSGMLRRYRGTPNMQLVGWTQANPLKRQFQINLRNHRKIMVVDGHRAFCGGINVHDQTTDGGIIRDYHFALTGPAVLELQYTFLRDWNFMTDEGPERLLREFYFPRLPLQGGSAVRIVNSGPTSELESVCDAFFLAISGAEHQVLLVTPYFVPNPEILRAMRVAALRGVDVRLIVPRKTNHACAGLAGESLYAELLDAGVRIFRRREPFMHAKACIVDDQIGIVGTANMDSRSLRLNYETNLILSGEAIVNELKHTVLDDLSVSVQLDPRAWESRPQVRRFIENAAALLTPVL